ncbi:MAG TPA: metallophosphatase, partial [Bacillota bacterium]|nr:metallophosphatase [Bacillota bacterium]
MPELKSLVLLHSNDMHGDFMSRDLDETLVGGVSMLSGYVSQVRAEEDTVLYVIAGDMLQGSLIDSEYRGISTMEIMNYISPDIVCVGNHEVDYGLPHLLFLEKFAKFPIITANLYIKDHATRLLQPYRLIEIDGLRVMFIGILTEAVLDSLRADKFVGTLVDIKEAAAEVGKICNAYRTTDVDLTVLLTHIGFENDCRLAAMLDPDWGVDIIIGGHSHTVLEQPALINNILIAQAGTGTAQIGRFDLIVNKDANTVEKFDWHLIPIDESHCPRDPAIERVIGIYAGEVDEKYGRILTHLTRKLTHPARQQETELGNLFADI